MLKFFARILFFILAAFGVDPVFAQQFLAPPPQPAVIGNDPISGPICAGPLGPGSCQAVQHYLLLQYKASQIHLQPIAFDPQVGPICQGPLGQGPCSLVALYLAAQQEAQQIQLQVIGFDPGVGQICAGPLGPGPCDAVRIYLLNVQSGGIPSQPIDLRNVSVVGQGTAAMGPMCGGPFGQMPCGMVAQTGLDAFGGAVPSQGSFGLPAGVNSGVQLARECAQRAGIDVAAFAGCTGQQVMLPAKQQAVLDCAVSTRDTPSFANCAAPKLGIALSDDQKKVAECAMSSGGQAAQFATCAGGSYLQKALTPDEKAILSCAANANGDAGMFASCSADRFLSRTQKAALDCAVSSSDASSFAICAGSDVGVKMSDDQRIVVKCALQSNGEPDNFAGCAGGALLGRNLGPNEQAVLNCAANSSGDEEQFAICSASTLLGAHLSREQQVAIQCAAQSQGDPTGMATCAGANMFNLQLNPEQQIAVQCVVSTGGQPYAAAGCIASRLTARELTKCLTDGVGGRGCFGDNNDLVGKNGWVRRTMGQIAGGPNSVINNPGQIWGGDNSFVRNPSQIFGGSNSFVRNPSQIWGGQNSVFNNPGQLLQAPRPINLGTVGGKRICLPWC